MRIIPPHPSRRHFVPPSGHVITPVARHKLHRLAQVSGGRFQSRQPTSSQVCSSILVAGLMSHSYDLGNLRNARPHPRPTPTKVPRPSLIMRSTRFPGGFRIPEPRPRTTRRAWRNRVSHFEQVVPQVHRVWSLRDTLFSLFGIISSLQTTPKHLSHRVSGTICPFLSEFSACPWLPAFQVVGAWPANAKVSVIGRVRAERTVLRSLMDRAVDISKVVYAGGSGGREYQWECEHKRSRVFRPS